MASSTTVHPLYIRNFPYPFFNAIQAGKKTIEVRYLSRYIEQIRVGDIIRFIDGRKIAKCEVRDVRKYHTYEQLFASEKVDSIVPGKNIETALKIHQSFPCFHYVTKNGAPQVAAFEIALIQSGLDKPRMLPYCYRNKQKGPDRCHLDSHKAKSSYIGKKSFGNSKPRQSRWDIGPGGERMRPSIAGVQPSNL